MSGDRRERQMGDPSELALKVADECWLGPDTKHLLQDRAVTLAFARLLDEVWDQPWLGNATTGQLIDELRARCEFHKTLNYRTVDGD